MIGPDLGGKVNTNNFFSGSAGYFGGIEYLIPNFNGLKMKIEFDGTNYQTESNPQTQDSKLNFGFVYPVTRGLMLKAIKYKRKYNKFWVFIFFGCWVKNPRKISMNKKTKLDNTKIIQKVTDRSDENLYKASLLYLKRQGISLQKASIEENKLHVVYSQNNLEVLLWQLGEP